MYQELLAQYAAPGATVVDNWWSSESGSPISGISLVPHASKDRDAAREQRRRSKEDGQQQFKPLTIRPGSAGKAAPGFDVRVVNDNGEEVKRGSMGNIVLGLPLAPTGFRSLWDDEERFYKSYLKRFEGKWIDTGGKYSSLSNGWRPCSIPQSLKRISLCCSHVLTYSDAGMIDKDGYISIMSRSDDLINTAGHRLSTGKVATQAPF